MILAYFYEIYGGRILIFFCLCLCFGFYNTFVAYKMTSAQILKICKVHIQMSSKATTVSKKIKKLVSRISTQTWKHILHKILKLKIASTIN